MKKEKTTPQVKEDHFICPTCEKEFANYECAKELKEGGEYFCQECWDIPE